MITRHPTEEAALKDREFWYDQGYDVGLLYPAEEGEGYVVYVAIGVDEGRKPGMSLHALIVGGLVVVSMWAVVVVWLWLLIG